MLGRIARARLYLSVAWTEEGLQRAGIVIVIRSHKIELVRRGIAHDRRKEIISQRKLLGPTPQRANSGTGVVIMSHRSRAVKKCEFVHCPHVPHAQEVITGMRQVRHGGAGQQLWRNCNPGGSCLRKTWNSSLDPVS